MDTLDRRLKRIESAMKKEKKHLLVSKINDKYYSMDCIFGDDDFSEMIEVDIAELEKKYKIVIVDVFTGDGSDCLSDILPKKTDEENI